MTGAAIWTALEALEAGDTRYAVEVLLTAAEDSIPAVNVERDADMFRCRFCSARFHAHGAREGHEVRDHPWETLADAA